MTQYQISIVVPLYNEEKVLPMLFQRLDRIITEMPENVEVVLVNDGSSDDTANIIKEKSSHDTCYQAVSLSRNFGHQLALTAGLQQVRASEAVFVIDGDLQDPPELLPEFFKKYIEGYDVVYAIRKKRKEGFFKRLSYNMFYRLFKKISITDMPLDSGDFSLMSRRVVDIINTMPEENRFIRGMRSWVGFKQIGFEYERAERAAGRPKYNFKQLRKLAYTGIFNFSDVPVKFITKMGVAAFVLGFVYFGYTLYRKVFYDDVPQGFTALWFGLVLFSGVQLISIGIIGEYVLRIFFQVKKRPTYIVDYKIVNKNKESGQGVL